MKNLSRALKDLGHRIEVVSGPPDPRLDEDIPVIHLPCLDLYKPSDPFRVPTLRELSNPINLVEWVGVSTMGFPEPMTFGIRAYRYLKQNRHRYDVVHDNQSLSYGIWAIARNIPTLATIHHPITVDRDIAVRMAPTTWNKMKQIRWFSFIGMQKRVSRMIRRIITVSEFARKDISREFGIPGNRFSVVPNGIDTHRFHPIPEIPRQKDRIIVTNSADTPLKGLAYLLLAVADLAKKRPVHLVVVGEPKKNGRISRMVRDLGIGDHLTFTGRIDNGRFIQEYARASMAVVPSVYEGFGLPVGEAMACGVPVVSTTGGALPEVVGSAGILVPPENSAALTLAISELLDNPERARSLGETGRKRVLERFTWERAARETAIAYCEVIRDYR